MYFCVVLCIVCFVSFSVLFVCICVLNYCHQVATQLQLNISYRIICTRRRTEFAKDPKTGHRDLSFLPLWNAFCTVFQLNKNILINPLKPELSPICYLLALLAHHFLHVSRIRVKSLTIRLLMSYIYICSTYSWCF